jgi:type IV pilus assembly protein PilQ
MRKIKHVVSSGCFFLCLGGWVYSGQLNAADGASGAKDTILNAAAAEAAVPGAVTDARPAPDAAAFAQATPPAVEPLPVVPAPAVSAPAVPAIAPTAPAGADLTKNVVNVDGDGKINISFSDMEVKTALRFFADRTKKNIIASQSVKGTVSVNLYNVTIPEAMEAMLKPNGFDYIEKGNFIYVYTADEIKEIAKRDRKTANQIFHLKYMNAQDANVLLKPFLSSVGLIALTPAAASGLETGTGSPGGTSLATDDTLVINDYAENLANVAGALRQLDVRPKQVLIEATVLDASLKDNNALGVDMISLSGLNFSDIGSVISPITGSATSDTTSSSNVTTPGQLAGTLKPDLNQKQFDVGTNFAKDVPQGGLSVGILSNHISFFLRALETVTDTTVVANPKILALNKQKGEVHIGQRLGYLTTSVTQTTQQQIVQFLDVGTKLIFRPIIADDGYIRMDIHPENSSGALDSRGVPQTNTTEITSSVMIRDGRTIVIGGLFSETTTASKGQVPILGNIPILGIPFRSTNDATTRQETIVLITPHIINDDTALYDESVKEQEDVQRMMLGNRAGLQPWGRDRIAHMWFAKAQEEAGAGNTGRAVMFCDWALNTNPRLLEAIKLREQLTNEKMDEKAGGSVGDLVKNVLRKDAATTPDKGGAGVYPPQAPATAPADKK